MSTQSYGMQPGLRLRPERLWLLLVVLWVVAVTLTPFDLSYAPNELQLRIRAVFRLESQDLLKDICHVASFFVVGLLVAANLRRSRDREYFALALIICGCVALESAQLFEPGRHARLTDLLLNVIGAVGGLTVGLDTSAGARLCEKLRLGTKRPIAEAIVLTGAIVVWWVVCLRPVFGGLTMTWDRTYPLCFGNEIGGERQWCGQLRYAGIYARALSGSEVAQLYDRVGQPDASQWRSSHHLLVGYDFQTKPTTPLKPDGELKDDSLDLDMPVDLSWSLTDGITISAPMILQSRKSAMRLADRLTSGQAFSVEAWALSADLAQEGPARLISNSSNWANRNFTLGQWHSSLVFRVRNRVNGPNATNYELWTPAVVATAWQHFVATYDHGVSIVYVNGAPQATVDLRKPRVYFGLAPNRLAGAAMLMLGVITISLPATVLFRTVFNFPTACLAAMIFTLVAGITPYLINCFGLDAARPLNFVGSFLLALLTYPLALRLIVRPADFHSARQNFAHAA